MKALTKISIGFLALVAVALWFTSCYSEDVTSGTNQGKMSSLTLTINTGEVGSTRATAWDKVNAPTQTDENKINTMTVGIFGSDNKVKTLVELTANKTVNGNKLTQDGKTATIVTTSLVKGDKVLVAVNAKSGIFQGVQDIASFNKVSGDINDAVTTSSDQTKEINTNIPMYGEGSLSENGSKSKFKVDINVYHFLAKVTLNDLEVDFDQKGAYKDASFTPSDVFLVNVPTNFYFAGNNTNNNDKAWGAPTANIHGFDAATTYKTLTTAVSPATPLVRVPTGWGTYKSFLTTGAWSAGTLQNKETANIKASNVAYFYVTPNGNNADATKTMLIIAGNFKKNNEDTNGTLVFYPLALNAASKSDGSYGAATNGGPDVFKVYPNKNYVCKVIIRNIGSIDPSKNLDPQTATITVTVQNFEDATQNTEFN